MRGQKKAFCQRGQHEANTYGRFNITISGHDHMGGETHSEHGIHIRSYCFQERNAYGEKLDFGAPTIGFINMGLPVGGIDKGPIIMTDIPKEYIDHYANNKPKMPTEKIYKNSIVKKTKD